MREGLPKQKRMWQSRGVGLLDSCGCLTLSVMASLPLFRNKLFSPFVLINSETQKALLILIGLLSLPGDTHGPLLQFDDIPVVLWMLF